MRADTFFVSRSSDGFEEQQPGRFQRFLNVLDETRGIVAIAIEDTGVGIPRHAIRKLGKPFEQVQSQFSKNHKGSGLGLAIAKSLAEMHGGSLRIRSTVGRGTTVVVRLPVNGPKPKLVA